MMKSRTALKVPAPGQSVLEGDRGQMEYRHIELKECRKAFPIRRDGVSSFRFPFWRGRINVSK